MTPSRIPAKGNGPVLRCAVLDDYQRVAGRYGDWRRLEERVDVRIAAAKQLNELISQGSVVVRHTLGRMLKKPARKPGLPLRPRACHC